MAQTETLRAPRAPFRMSVGALLELAADEAPAYAAADPFPHVVFDGLFDDDSLQRVVNELPPPSHPGWTFYDTHNERKSVFDQPEHLGPEARSLAETLNSSEFVRFVERLTGIDALISDPHLTAAGYMRSDPGGFLDPHIDFSQNPKLFLSRRVNALLYLNPGWQESWGGQLEIFPALDAPPAKEIVPVMNRLVVFSTPEAPHGHPKPIRAPRGRSRLCFSAYYYTSPVLPDAPPNRPGVLFSERRPPESTLRRAAKATLPPVAVSGLRRVKHRLASRS